MAGLDNNLAERTIRGPVVTRKNAGGSRNPDTARTAASAWTVTATVQMAARKVTTYLTAYLDACGRNGGNPLAGETLDRFLPWKASPGDLRLRAQPPPGSDTPSQLRRHRRGYKRSPRRLPACALTGLPSTYVQRAILVVGCQALVLTEKDPQMSDEGVYVPRQGDMVKFDSPPSEGGGGKLFQVTSHDTQTGMTSFTGLARALSADEMAERGARKRSVVSPGEVKPDWTGAGRRLAEKGAGHRPKIHHLSPHPAGLRMLRADEQAALALAQRAADQAGETVLLARTGTGELVIGSPEVLRAVGEALRAQVVLSVQPGLDGSGGSVTLRQARELLGSDRAREAVAAALASVPGPPAPAGYTAAEAVLQAVAGLLPLEEKPLLTTPGWQYREELLPEEAPR